MCGTHIAREAARCAFGAWEHAALVPKANQFPEFFPNPLKQQHVVCIPERIALDFLQQRQLFLNLRNAGLRSGRETLSHSCFLACLNTACYAPGALHWGTYFFEQSCISIEFRYNTNKDYFLNLYFIWEGDSLWQERRTLMRRGRR